MTLWQDGLAKSRDKLKTSPLPQSPIITRRSRVVTYNEELRLIKSHDPSMRLRDKLKALNLHLQKTYVHQTRPRQGGSPTFKVVCPFDHVTNVMLLDRLAKSDKYLSILSSDLWLQNFAVSWLQGGVSERKHLSRHLLFCFCFLLICFLW